MICSSRARNRSFKPVVSCFFGRIVPSDATTQSRRAIRGNPKNEIARSGGPKPETLQSQIDDQSRIRISINTLDVLHRRLSITSSAGLTDIKLGGCEWGSNCG